MQKNKKILIVENDEMIRTICKKELDKNGYKVIELLDGKYALKIIKKESPNLVLLALLLPKKDGLEVLQEIRESKDSKIREIPVIIMSKIINKQDIKEIKKLGIEEYLIKSDNNPIDIAKKVNDFLNKQ